MMGVFVQLNEGVRNPVRGDSLPIGYVIQENGCWEWVGARTNKGYGNLRMSGWARNIPAHRWMYEQVKGAIPAGLHLDHLCRNRACVNPDHLEPVTNRENILRGRSPSAVSHAKTVCKHGHPLTEDNYYDRKGRGHLRIRVCKQCIQRKNAAAYLRRKAL